MQGQAESFLYFIPNHQMLRRRLIHQYDHVPLFPHPFFFNFSSLTSFPSINIWQFISIWLFIINSSWRLIRTNGMIWSVWFTGILMHVLQDIIYHIWYTMETRWYLYNNIWVYNYLKKFVLQWARYKRQQYLDYL